MPKKIAKPQPQAPSEDLEKTSIEINGKTYFLCFDLRELSKAEQFYRRQGHDVNLLIALSEFTLAGTRDAFPCLLHAFHPELTWDQAQELFSLDVAYKLGGIIAEVMQKALGKPAPASAPSTAAGA